MQQAIGATRSAIIITDSNQKDDPIIYANTAFYELTGYDENDVIGHNCRFLQGPETNPEHVKKLRDAVRNGNDIHQEILNYRKDGTEFWNDLIMSPVHNEDGNLTHFIGLQLDITENVTYQQELADINQKLKESNDELQQFTYAVSHDLQEPLRMVVSFMQLVEKRYNDKLDDDGREFIRHAVDGSKRMQQLIDDLLLLSRVRTKVQPFKKTSLQDAMKDALLNLKISIEETNAVISTKGDLPHVSADKMQMIQLFQNLIGNAIKYRKPDVAPNITIIAKQVDTMVEVTIRDNGIGINSEFHDRVFGIFQRLHTRDEYEGSGVGLAICKKIVEQHGGVLTIVSHDDGSAFTFTLPILGQHE